MGNILRNDSLFVLNEEVISKTLEDLLRNTISTSFNPDYEQTKGLEVETGESLSYIRNSLYLDCGPTKGISLVISKIKGESEYVVDCADTYVEGDTTLFDSNALYIDIFDNSHL
jgi:hypothetical protein